MKKPVHPAITLFPFSSTNEASKVMLASLVVVLRAMLQVFVCQINAISGE